MMITEYRKIVFNEDIEGNRSYTELTFYGEKEETTTYTIDRKGKHTFTVYDIAGNKTTETINDVKYDSVKPVYDKDSEASDISVTLNPSVPTQTNVNITVTAKDVAENENNYSSGIRQINRVSDNDINAEAIDDPHTNDNGDEEFITEFEVHDNGEYYFVVEDVAGNKTLVPVTVTFSYIGVNKWLRMMMKFS